MVDFSYKGSRLTERRALVVVATLAVLLLYPAGSVLRSSAYAPAATGTQAQTTSNPVVSVSLFNEKSHPSGTYSVLLWRYLEGGGSVLASSGPVKSGQTLNLYDNGLSSFYHTQPDVHYSILILRTLSNSSILHMVNYHWAALITDANANSGGYVKNTENIVLTILTNGSSLVSIDGSILSYQTTKPSSRNIVGQSGNISSTTPGNAPAMSSASGSSVQSWPAQVLREKRATKSTGSVNSANAPNSCFWDYAGNEYCWIAVQNWYTQATTLGEATGSGYMTDYFSYGVSSGSELDVVESVNGGGWSVSGSWTLYNGESQAVNWSPLYCCSNWLANSYFNYEEDQLEECAFNGGCGMLSEYQIWSPGWNGGDESWIDAGTSSSQPGDCLSYSTIQADYSYAPYAGGSGYTYTTSNGYRYNVAITIGSGVQGTSFSAQIGDTTYYNQHTTQQLDFGTQYSYYYVYTNAHYSDVSQWPVLFTANSAGQCG